MKFFSKIITINFFIFFFIGTSYANQKIAFIDIDYLIKNSIVGKRVLEKIDIQNKKNINQLEKKNQSLIDLELEIKNKKNILSETDFNNEVLSFRKKVQLFTNEKNDIVKKFNNLKKKEIEDTFELFNPIISLYMKENSINIILDTKNIFMGNVEANLTEDILKEINNKLK